MRIIYKLSQSTSIVCEYTCTCMCVCIIYKLSQSTSVVCECVYMYVSISVCVYGMRIIYYLNQLV